MYVMCADSIKINIIRNIIDSPGRIKIKSLKEQTVGDRYSVSSSGGGSLIAAHENTHT